MALVGTMEASSAAFRRKYFAFLTFLAFLAFWALAIGRGLPTLGVVREKCVNCQPGLAQVPGSGFRVPSWSGLHQIPNAELGTWSSFSGVDSSAVLSLNGLCETMKANRGRRSETQLASRVSQTQSGESNLCATGVSPSETTASNRLYPTKSE